MKYGRNSLRPWFRQTLFLGVMSLSYARVRSIEYVVAHTDLSGFGIHEAQLSLKYYAEIHEVGPMVAELIPHGILIFFGETAPEELREVALVHNRTQLLSDLEVDDFLKISPPGGDQQIRWYRLTAVGAVANANLAELGHLVIHFDGASIANLPGTISVEPSLVELPPLGTTFELFGREKK